MPHVTPSYSRKDVNHAGEMLAGRLSGASADAEWASEVLSNWRACHAYPINTFQATLRQKLARIDPNALVAQRLKRTPSIIAKLQRFPGMQLSRMQDIGGLRAVVASMPLLRRLEAAYEKSRFAHQLVGKKDYVAEPKGSGYRSVHLVYRYRKESLTIYNGFQLEVQLRTRIQHTWATAVETAETFLNHALKSSQGPAEWLEFFSLAGSAFALVENCAPVPKHSPLSRTDTFRETLRQAQVLGVNVRLQAYSLAAKALREGAQSGKGPGYYLLNLRPAERKLSWTGFSKDRLDDATAAYHEAEARVREGDPSQVVLVSTSSLDALKKAYPNYFLDTHAFLKQLENLRTHLA
jgi:putative GTP pyrophosphokinase